MSNDITKSVYGIGVDICNIRRMYEKISARGDDFAKKILTICEYRTYEDMTDRTKQAQYVAKCWAVKEAFVKALGIGFTGNFMWSDVGYLSPKGSVTGVCHPRVNLSKDAYYDPMMQNKVIHLSVSDEVDNAIAFVTIEEVKNDVMI